MPRKTDQGKKLSVLPRLLDGGKEERRGRKRGLGVFGASEGERSILRLQKEVILVSVLEKKGNRCR